MNEVMDKPASVERARDFDGVYEAFIASREDFNSAPERNAARLGNIYCKRLAALEAATPGTPLDFVKKFHALWDDGDEPPQKVIDQMVGEAATLIGEISTMNVVREMDPGDIIATVERQRADNRRAPMPDSEKYDDLGVEIETAEVLCRKVGDVLAEMVPTHPAMKDATVLLALLERQIEVIDTAARRVWGQIEAMHQAETAA